MEAFPLDSIRRFDDITVITDDGTFQGIVEDTTRDQKTGFGVHVRLGLLGNHEYVWFYVRKGATFYR